MVGNCEQMSGIAAAKSVITYSCSICKLPFGFNKTVPLITMLTQKHFCDIYTDIELKLLTSYYWFIVKLLCTVNSTKFLLLNKIYSILKS